MNKITIVDIKKYQEKRENMTTIGEFKKLGRELAVEFGLTDREAINILNNKSDKILDILYKRGE